MAFEHLGTLVDAQRTRRATPKHQIEKHVITREARRQEKKDKADEFRAAVWKRDKSRSRASGTALSRSSADPKKVGEVHHVLKRSTNPSEIYNPSNGLLLSRFEHALAEAECPNAPDKHYLDIEGSDDRALPQTFIWRDRHGKETKRRVS